MPPNLPPIPALAGTARNVALPNQNNLTLIGIGAVAVIFVIIIIVACLARRKPGKKGVNVSAA